MRQTLISQPTSVLLYTPSITLLEGPDSNNTNNNSLPSVHSILHLRHPEPMTYTSYPLSLLIPIEGPKTEPVDPPHTR